MVEETNRNCGGCGDAVHIAKILLSVVWALVLNVYYILQDLFYLIASRPEKIITGQHVLITGAGRGLGREFALRFAKEGCRISCVDVDSEGCTETVKMINEQANAEVAKAYTTDITSQEQISKLAEQMNKDNGPLDILVNNAGIVAAQNILDVPLQGIQKMVDVNLMSHFWTIRQFLPEMKRRKRGHIVAVSSVASFTVAANIAPYTATKCGVTGLMGCLREELRFDYQFVHTTTIHPFFISPPQKYKHWDTKSVLPELTAASVAAIAVDGIKQNKKTVTIPGYMYYTLLLIQALPTKAADLWRDIFFAKIDRPKS